MNILTTSGLCARYVTDWAGVDATVKGIAIKLCTPNLPGDTMTMSGQVTEKHDGDGVIAIEVAGKNAWGNHVTGTVRIALPRGA